MHHLRPSARHPFEVYLLLLSIVSGLPILFGSPAPGSIEAAMPHWGVRVWGAGLALGAVVALLGVLKTRPDSKARTVSVTGLVLEQVGLVMVASSTLLYVVVALVYVGVSAIVPIGIVAAYGISCLMRWVQIQRAIDLEFRLRREATEGEQDG